jgi:hypothetical protein
MTGDDDRELLRARMRVIGDRARRDEAFRCRLRADPAGILRAYGIPSAHVPRLLASVDGPFPDVAGYLLCTCILIPVTNIVES